MAASRASQISVYVLLGLLILALGGFGVTNFGGSVSSVARVGDAEIDVDTYARSLQRRIAEFGANSGRNLTISQARAIGIDRLVLAELVGEAALENETRRIGLSVGDGVVRERVLSTPAFGGVDGSFDRDAYEFALDRVGLSVRDYEERVRADAAAELLSLAVVGGVTVPDAGLNAVLSHLAEARTFDWAVLEAGDSELPQRNPTKAELEAYHAANPGEFTAPEARLLTYAWIVPDMLVDSVEVPEDEIRGLYEDRIGDYVFPERRLVERLVFGSMSEASAAKAALDAGERTFVELVEARDLTLEDIDLGAVTMDDLHSAAAQAVFALAEAGVAGPLESALGPAVYRVNGILSAQETPYSEVRDVLRAEKAEDRARRRIGDMIEEVEDLLAGGATLEELADETALTLGSISLGPDDDEGIAAYEEFRFAAAAAGEGDFPEVGELSDGGIFALRLDGLVPESIRPFDQVEDLARERWTAAEARALSESLAADLVANLEPGQTLSDKDIDAFAEGPLTRDATVQGTPGELVGAVFELAESGDAAVVTDESGVFLIQLKTVLPPDPDAPLVERLRDSLEADIRFGVANDLLALFTDEVRSEAGIEIDQAAINAVHAQFP